MAIRGTVSSSIFKGGVFVKFKAAVLEESHKPLVVQEIEWNRKLDWCQVLVKVLYTTICGSQLNEIDAVKGTDKFLPHLLGHEGVAIVQECGPGVMHIKRNDLVVLHWRPGAGMQSPTPAYWGTPGTRLIKAGWVTTFNEYAVVSENRCTPIPDSQHNREMSLFGCAVTTAHGVICNETQVKIGDAVVVLGVGGVGLCVVQMAALAGAAQIIAVDIDQKKLKLAEHYGATYVLDSRDSDTQELGQAIIDHCGRQPDVVIETTGLKHLYEMGYKIAVSNGRFVSVGVQKENISINPLKLKDGLRLTQSHGGNCQPDRDIPRLFNMLQEGRFRLEGMIAKTVSLDNINEGIEYMRSGGVGRVLVDMGAA
jgi:S-(hydroxymethyl)glutathione dehydrogenase / alcohol dehydrogenase